MRALICDAFGPIETLRLGEMPEPAPAPDDVLIQVAYASATFADGLVVQGKHIARPAFPFVPGVEAAGRVLAVGDHVTHVRPGDRVMASGARGAYAEHMVVEQAGVFLLPDKVNYAAGAASLTSYGTAIHALVDRGRLAEGETLLVLAAGGSVGLAAVEIGALLGAHVIAAASTQEKRDLATAKGAAGTIDYMVGDLRETLRHVAPGGIDVIFDPVGGAASAIVARALRRAGRHLIVGFASGDIPRLPANLYLLKQADLLGILWGESRTKATQQINIARIADWLAEGRLVPEIGAIFPLERGAEALAAVAARKVSGKALIALSEDV